MRMPLEELCGSLLRVRANDREGSHRVADIRNAIRIDLLGLAERSAHVDDRGLVLFNPRLPCGHPLLLLGTPVRFRKRIPGRPFRAVLATKKDGEISIGGGHDISSQIFGWVMTISAWPSAAAPAAFRQSRRQPSARLQGNPTSPEPD